MKTTKHTLAHASLFSGIGGAELAARWMGWQNLFHCEINPFGRRVLEYHFPESESYEDITKTDFTPWRGRVDVLTAGFPCQPFSLAGRRGGAQDDRYLWPETLRALSEIRPAWLVGENVAGILTMVEPGEAAPVGSGGTLFEESHLYREERVFTIERICTDLEREGYAVQPFVIPACAVGAPHRRDRVWIVAHRDGDRQRERESEQVAKSRSCREADHRIDGEDGATAHTDNPRIEVSEAERADVSVSFGVSTDTECSGWRKVHQNVQSEQPNGSGADCYGLQRDAFKCGPDGWTQFPTQSPICGRDDGLPSGLDGITVSKWRAESIKAYGNAWVPQVAYEIFKAIEAAENPASFADGTSEAPEAESAKPTA